MSDLKAGFISEPLPCSHEFAPLTIHYPQSLAGQIKGIVHHPCVVFFEGCEVKLAACKKCGMVMVKYD